MPLWQGWTPIELNAINRGGLLGNYTLFANRVPHKLLLVARILSMAASERDHFGCYLEAASNRSVSMHSEIAARRVLLEFVALQVRREEKRGKETEAMERVPGATLMRRAVRTVYQQYE